MRITTRLVTRNIYPRRTRHISDRQDLSLSTHPLCRGEIVGVRLGHRYLEHLHILSVVGAGWVGQQSTRGHTRTGGAEYLPYKCNIGSRETPRLLHLTALRFSHHHCLHAPVSKGGNEGGCISHCGCLGRLRFFQIRHQCVLQCLF